MVIERKAPPRRQYGRSGGYLKCAWALVLVWLVLGGCSVQVLTETPLPVTPTVTATATESPTETPTVVWFPPTETPTPFPTQEVTAVPVVALPAVGELLVTEDFSDQGNWLLYSATRGSAAFGINELTIALLEPRVYISANRTDLYLTDFYMEVTAEPSLCRGQDEYGLLLRMASPADFYRFSLACDGQFRLDRIRGGTAASPLTWTPSAAVPRAVPATVKIGVWADGENMHFYLNDNYQVSVATPLIPGGTIGFFARSAGEQAVTVSFSDLLIWEVLE